MEYRQFRSTTLESESFGVQILATGVGEGFVQTAKLASLQILVTFQKRDLGLPLTKSPSRRDNPRRRAPLLNDHGLGYLCLLPISEAGARQDSATNKSGVHYREVDGGRRNWCCGTPMSLSSVMHHQHEFCQRNDNFHYTKDDPFSFFFDMFL